MRRRERLYESLRKEHALWPTKEVKSVTFALEDRKNRPTLDSPWTFADIVPNALANSD
jgi:hypothetical protein